MQCNPTHSLPFSSPSFLLSENALTHTTPAPPPPAAVARFCLTTHNLFPRFPVLCADSTKNKHQQLQEKKRRKRQQLQQQRRSDGGGKRGLPQSWSFDQLMLIWDDIFDKCCDERAPLLSKAAQKGLLSYGRGCVLVYESLQTKPRGAGSGFTRKSSKTSSDPPAYVSTGWKAFYVPRSFILDPSVAPHDAIDLAPTEPFDVADEKVFELAVSPPEHHSTLDSRNPGSESLEMLREKSSHRIRVSSGMSVGQENTREANGVDFKQKDFKSVQVRWSSSIQDSSPLFA